jgi:hypothetical protein
VRVLGVLAGLLGAAAIVLVIALVNGGYIYRVECPRAGGSTETEWTYRWNSVIPYVGYDRSGCETHSGTRVALDAIGLWSIDDDPGRREAEDHSSEFPPEAVAAMKANCSAGGESRAFCDCAFDELTIRLSPDEVQQLADAIRGGATTFEELPDDLRAKVTDAAAAAENDCRS